MYSNLCLSFRETVPLSLLFHPLSDLRSDDTLEPDSEDELFINEAPSLDDDEDDEEEEEDSSFQEGRGGGDVVRDNDDDVSNFMMEEDEEDTTTYGSPGVREEEAASGPTQDQDTSSLGEHSTVQR